MVLHITFEENQPSSLQARYLFLKIVQFFHIQKVVTTRLSVNTENIGESYI